MHIQSHSHVRATPHAVLALSRCGTQASQSQQGTPYTPYGDTRHLPPYSGFHSLEVEDIEFCEVPPFTREEPSESSPDPVSFEPDTDPQPAVSPDPSEPKPGPARPSALSQDLPPTGPLTRDERSFFAEAHIPVNAIEDWESVGDAVTGAEKVCDVIQEKIATLKREFKEAARHLRECQGEVTRLTKQKDLAEAARTILWESGKKHASGELGLHESTRWANQQIIEKRTELGLSVPLAGNVVGGKGGAAKPKVWRSLTGRDYAGVGDPSNELVAEAQQIADAEGLHMEDALTLAIQRGKERLAADWKP